MKFCRSHVCLCLPWPSFPQSSPCISVRWSLKNYYSPLSYHLACYFYTPIFSEVFSVILSFLHRSPSCSIYRSMYLKELTIFHFFEGWFLLQVLNFIFESIQIDLQLLFYSDMFSDFSFWLLNCFFEYMVVLFDNITRYLKSDTLRMIAANGRCNSALSRPWTQWN